MKNFALTQYTNEQIFSHIAFQYLSNKNIDVENIINKNLSEYFKKTHLNDELLSYVSNNQDLVSLKTLESIFFSQINLEMKNSNGIVYTPEYIVDYITNETICFDKSIVEKTIIDPACGCGVFLLNIIKKASKITDIDLISFVENNIYGIDIDKNAIAQTKFFIKLFLVSLGYDKEDLNLNILAADSLETDWVKAFNLNKKFDYIIGNPPYIKIQNINKEYLSRLKNNYKTMQSGSVNVFYAFIEKSVDMVNAHGRVSFILPNNFLKIKSASCLRAFLYQNNLIERIVDFDCNMIFSPVMTYNCILFLNKLYKKNFYYSRIEKTDNIHSSINSLSFLHLPSKTLQNDSWIFHDDATRAKIEKIESFELKLGQFIRTGIATLRDKLYLVKKGSDVFFTNLNDQAFEIEEDIVKPIYKVSDIKSETELNHALQYIIYPYKIINNIVYPIPEDDLAIKYPKTYQYLMSIKELLSERSSDKNMQFWYQYGRSQGLNNFGNKLLFPQFLKNPRFIYCSNVNSLFCNGFAISDNEKISLKLLQKILHSSVFAFYISKTSYTIDGGFYCYQKKYLSNFSIPSFSKSEVDFLTNCKNQDAVNDFLEKKYF